MKTPAYVPNPFWFKSPPVHYVDCHFARAMRLRENELVNWMLGYGALICLVVGAGFLCGGLAVRKDNKRIREKGLRVTGAIVDFWVDDDDVRFPILQFSTQGRANDWRCGLTQGQGRAGKLGMN